MGDSLPFRRVLLVGISVRAAAESAARAGFAPTAIDAFADLDQHPSVDIHPLHEDYSPAAAVAAAASINTDAVVYGGGFENHPGLVATLGRGRALWGNSPEVLMRVRDPEAVAAAFRARGHAVPEVRTRDPGPGKAWLIKPLRAGGGHGVRPCRGSEGPGPGDYIQERIEGSPGSVAFLAARGRAVPLGVCRQLIGEKDFGADGYRYCGNILSWGTEASGLYEAATRMAATAARAFDLVGLNGIDFVARESEPYPVEVNPRWCASMELVERASGLSVFAAHVSACARGELPDLDIRSRYRPSTRGAVGKAIVFARRDVRVGDTREWLERGGSVRDVPRPGQRIRCGRPVATVFATADDHAACRLALADEARRVYAALSPWEHVEPGVSVAGPKNSD